MNDIRLALFVRRGEEEEEEVVEEEVVGVVGGGTSPQVNPVNWREPAASDHHTRGTLPTLPTPRRALYGVWRGAGRRGGAKIIASVFPMNT